MDPVKWCQTLYSEDLKAYPSFENEDFDSSILSINAIVYSRMKHEPHHPRVSASYGVFKSEMLRQMDRIHETGLCIVATSHKPYSGSKSMLKDLEVKQLQFLSTQATQDSFSNIDDTHPLSEIVNTKYGIMVLNDVFRVVHDVYAHGQGHSFSPKGEHMAWLAHRRTLDERSHLALWCETKGQNSWINFGEHVIPNSKLSERSFAPQKVGVVDAWLY